jgi:hypothetical protein
MKALLGFDQRHGREDNLMYRQLEQSREKIKNEVQDSKVKKRTKTKQGYDFRKDFLRLK